MRCAARRCTHIVERGQMMCRAHWLALPKALRTTIHITHRHRFVADHLAAVERARDLIERGETAVAAGGARVVRVDGGFDYLDGRAL